MADLVMGAMGRLAPKLGELLKEEYNLQAGVKDRVRKLTLELEGAQAALHKVAEAPWMELDEQVRLWARELRESSYDMEDVLDTFLVRVKGGHDPDEQERLLKRLGEKMTSLFKKSKARREISGAVKDIMSHLEEVTERCRRYKVDDIVARPGTASTVDPRLAAMYTHVNKLVGIDKSSNELMSMLRSHTKMKIVSVVGTGGLGKTTLAKAVYDKLRGDFDCGAFVSVGRDPDLQKVFQEILIKLDSNEYERFNFAVFHKIDQFIDKIREFLHGNKRHTLESCRDATPASTPTSTSTTPRNPHHVSPLLIMRRERLSEILLLHGTELSSPSSSLPSSLALGVLSCAIIHGSSLFFSTRKAEGRLLRLFKQNGRTAEAPETATGTNIVDAIRRASVLVLLEAVTQLLMDVLLLVFVVDRAVLTRPCTALGAKKTLSLKLCVCFKHSEYLIV